MNGRADYFGNVGIIRDIMQNLLLQMLASLAMEPPVSLAADDVRDEKIKLLRSINPLTADHFATGQHTAKDDTSLGYLENEGVPNTQA